MSDLRIISEPHCSQEDATFVRDSLELFNVGVTGAPTTAVELLKAEGF